MPPPLPTPQPTHPAHPTPPTAHLLWLLTGVIVDPAHAEGVLVCAGRSGTVGPYQAVQAVRKLQLQLGSRRLRGRAGGQKQQEGQQKNQASSAPIYVRSAACSTLAEWRQAAHHGQASVGLLQVGLAAGGGVLLLALRLAGARAGGSHVLNLSTAQLRVWQTQRHHQRVTAQSCRQLLCSRQSSCGMRLRLPKLALPVCRRTATSAAASTARASTSHYPDQRCPLQHITTHPHVQVHGQVGLIACRCRRSDTVNRDSPRLQHRRRRNARPQQLARSRRAVGRLCSGEDEAEGHSEDALACLQAGCAAAAAAAGKALVVELQLDLQAGLKWQAVGRGIASASAHVQQQGRCSCGSASSAPPGPSRASTAPRWPAAAPPAPRRCWRPRRRRRRLRRRPCCRQAALPPA